MHYTKPALNSLHTISARLNLAPAQNPEDVKTCPAHFTILRTIQALVPLSSFGAFILLLSTLFTPAFSLSSGSCSRILVAVRKPPLADSGVLLFT